MQKQRRQPCPPRLDRGPTGPGLLCLVCKLEFPSENHFNPDAHQKTCWLCKPGAKARPQAPLRPAEKAKIKELMTYRIVKDKLLYVIGIPKSFAEESLLKSDKFYGQFGQLEKIVINHNPHGARGGSENQVAIYVHYKSSIGVAIALRCLNGLRIMESVVLKCSYGTSKYCANFLSNAHCAANADGKCPFIHEMERRRDKVIQDDNEFKDYLQVQSLIAADFCRALKLPDYAAPTQWQIKSGLPGPMLIWGLNYP